MGAMYVDKQIYFNQLNGKNVWGTFVKFRNLPPFGF